MLKNKSKQITFIVLYFLIILPIILSPYIGRIAIGFSLFCFLVSLVVLEKFHCYALLFGILPIASIFKFSYNSMSMLTICEILLLLRLWLSPLKKDKIDIKVSFLLALLLLVLYIIVVNFDFSGALTLVKLLVRILLLYYLFNCKATDDEKNVLVKNIAYAISISLIISLFATLFDNYRMRADNYLLDVQYDQESDILRNGGLIGDPNYCTMAIIVTLSLLGVLYYFKKISIGFWVVSTPLFLLGFTTYSKSYLLCVLVFLVLLELFVLIPRHRFLAIIFAIMVVVLIPMAISGRFELINLILDRFSSVGVSTGRFELNEIYMEYITGSPKVLLFGCGYFVERIVGENNVHNIYIEFLFRLGVVGSLMYLFTISSIFNKSKEGLKLVNFFPLIFALILYLALAGVDRFEFFYYIIISAVSILFVREDKKELLHGV